MLKKARVQQGRAHAALVYDGSTCVGWCQFGPTDELPRIKFGRAYLQGLSALPDWRITCFFVDSKYRRKGVSSAALDGALAEIARLGGGKVESYPQEIGDSPVSSSFLNNGTLAMFERCGFKRVRPLGKNHWVVEKTVSRRLGRGRQKRSTGR
jgi:GNAT superfamily N-acetyltransferase